MSINTYDQGFRPTDFVEQIEQLKRAKDYPGAKRLLEQSIEWFDENPTQEEGPWYFEQLAIVNRKLGLVEEAQKYNDRYEQIIIAQARYQIQSYKETSKSIKQTYYPNGLPLAYKHLKVLQKHGLLSDAEETSASFVRNFIDKTSRKNKPDISMGQSVDPGSKQTKAVEQIGNIQKLNYDFAVLDVETANQSFASICQIGLAFVKDGEVIETWGTYVDPEEKFTNTRIHGIDAGKVSGSPTFPSAWSQTFDLIDGFLVFHHTNFDRAALTQALDKYNIQKPKLRLLDSSNLARTANPKFSVRGYGLDNLCKTYQVSYENHHDAIADASMTAKVICCLLSESKTTLKDWSHLETNFQTQRSRNRVNRTVFTFEVDLEDILPGHNSPTINTHEKQEVNIVEQVVEGPLPAFSSEISSQFQPALEPVQAQYSKSQYSGVLASQNVDKPKTSFSLDWFKTRLWIFLLLGLVMLILGLILDQIALGFPGLVIFSVGIILYLLKAWKIMKNRITKKS